MPPCSCGRCGQMVRPGRRYVHGHNPKSAATIAGHARWIDEQKRLRRERALARRGVPRETTAAELEAIQEFEAWAAENPEPLLTRLKRALTRA